MLDVGCVAGVIAHQLLQQLATTIAPQQLGIAEAAPFAAAVVRSRLCQLQEPAAVLTDVHIVTAHYGDFRRRVLASCEKKTSCISLYILLSYAT